MRPNRPEWYLGRHWLLLFGFQIVPLIISIFAVETMAALARTKQGDPFLVRIALILAVVGLVLLFFAKLPLYRQRKFFTFGPKAMPRTSRRVYWTAYAVIGLSVVLMTTLLAVLR